MLDPSRGFLSNWPPDVIAIVNGEPVTTTDILQGKRKRRRRQLALKRLTGPVEKPCFIWTFYNDTTFYLDVNGYSTPEGRRYHYNRKR